MELNYITAIAVTFFLGVVVAYVCIISALTHLSYKKKNTVGMIPIKYRHALAMPERTPKGDWIDLRACSNVQLKKGEFTLIDLGVAMKLPKGFEAHVVPRSSSFKNWGIIQTNGIGIIDNSYCGNEDYWKMPVYATKDCVIHAGERICQFRIVRKQPNFAFNIVANLADENRGGFGSTGV